MRRRWLAAGALLCSFGAPVRAEDKKPEVPQITAITPFDLVRGNTAFLKLRGLKLTGATELRFPNANGALTAELKEKKAAPTIEGFDPKTIGDTQVEVKFEVPREFTDATLALAVVTPEGSTAPVLMRIFDAGTFQDEKEPNGGFREAQTLEAGKTLRGAIEGGKDVDVFRFNGPAGQRISVEISAAREASLLDAVLTALDAHGHFLASCDDTTTHDPMLTVAIPADGACYLEVQDAHDRGGGWFDYHLTVKEIP